STTFLMSALFFFMVIPSLVHSAVHPGDAEYLFIHCCILYNFSCKRQVGFSPKDFLLSFRFWALCTPGAPPRAIFFMNIHYSMRCSAAGASRRSTCAASSASSRRRTGAGGSAGGLRGSAQ